MQFPPPLEKRKRSANFSEEEKLRFVRLLSEKGDVIINKITSHDTRTNKLKEEAWNLICRDHNSSGSIMRNTETLKKLWQKLKSDAKTYNAAARQQVRGTGGGPCMKSCNPVLELVVEITGRGSSGISGVSDCDSDLIPVIQYDIIEAGPPSPTPPAADPQEVLFETTILLESDVEVEAQKYTEELTNVSADAVPLTTTAPNLKRRRPNLSVLSLHQERSEPARPGRAKNYSNSLASERLRSEREKTELIKLKINQEMELHNLKMDNERKLHSFKMQILEKITKKIEVPTTQITAVAGEPVYLPCDISMQDEEDAVLLVLWYKEDMGTPIYSVDARERDFGVAERWSDESVFASRAYFLPQKRPAELGVDRVRPSDQGMYRCRVDFKMAQTRNSKVNLTVIVPPSKLVITDDKGDIKQAIVGPFVEGDTFTLKCDVIGARPRPWVKWFRDEIETDTPSTPLPNNGVRGIIRVGPLTRADVRAALTCRASNHARAHPIETTLTLDMNFPPLTVHILGSNQPLSASRRYDLLCQSSGSRPPASITWWKNGHRINNAKETLSTDGNTTTSTVSLQLTKSDAGAKLACRASNPQMPSVPPLEHDWVLDIQYVPETVVRLGTNLDPRNIREVSDVYFDCIIRAHPYVYKVEWRHNGKTLQHNVGHGIIISNQSLVLQGVGRRTAGNYTCVGFNAEGDGESKPFLLDVLYAPTCRSTQQRVHGVAKQERANISCHVDANPPEVSFRWTFNNTAHNNEVSQSYVSKTGTSSIVTYTPHNEMDYGTLLCWAHNKIGKQRVPCVYHIIAAGRPDQVHNCSVVNASLTSFGVRCSEGFNGGLPQSFLLEVREPLTQEIVSNVSSAVPRFNAIGLSPGRTYAASVLAYNAKGRGDPYPLRASTLRPPEKHHVHDKSLDLPRTAFQMSGAMSAAVGGGGILMVAIVLFMFAVKHRCAKRKPRSAPPLSSQPASPDKLREKDDSESDDRNPDIIPSDRDSDQMQLDYYRQQQVSTISPPPGSRVRGSVAGVRGGLPAYCALRTAPMHGECDNVNSGIPPPARFASGACTLPRNTTLNPGDSRCIPLQHLRTLPRPLPAPSPTPRVPPRDTPL